MRPGGFLADLNVSDQHKSSFRPKTVGFFLQASLSEERVVDLDKLLDLTSGELY